MYQLLLVIVTTMTLFSFRGLPKWQEGEPVCVPWGVFWHPFAYQWYCTAGGPEVSQAQDAQIRQDPGSPLVFQMKELDVNLSRGSKQQGCVPWLPLGPLLLCPVAWTLGIGLGWRWEGHQKMYEKPTSCAHPCPSSISMPYASQGLYLETEAGHYKLSSEAYGFVARIDGSGNFQVLLSDRYFNKTCGLCGNLNIFAEDDFRTQEGKLSWDTISLWCGSTSVVPAHRPL